MTRQIKRQCFVLAIAFAPILHSMGCSMHAGEEGQFDGELGREEQPERWNAANDPSRVDSSFVYQAGSLPVTGASEVVPYPGDYWATYLDSINYRWNGSGSLSPAEKFGRAFGKQGVDIAVSNDTGIRGQTALRTCRSNWDCSRSNDGSVCAVPRGASSGRCIPTWWGICHGWAPSVIEEPAPQKPVTKNGVTFYASDLQALMSLVYSRGLPVKFLSERCNTGARTDARGRVVDGECRDMNPGTFHVTIANMLGLRAKSVVEDRMIDAEVWNQPIRDYRVTNATQGKLREVSMSQALSLLGLRNQSSYPYNTSAKRFFYVTMELRYIAEADPSRTVPNPDSYTKTEAYQYILEADAQGNIMGGEWVGQSRTRHPDFMWWPTGKPTGRLANGLITYPEVKALNDLAATR